MQDQINYRKNLIKTVKEILMIFFVLMLCFNLQSKLLAADGAIPVTLDFSTDQGKTYNDQVVVALGGSVWVRASWDYMRLDGSKNPYVVGIKSRERDFASANVGFHNWGGEKGWYQKQPPGYIRANKQSIVMKMNFGARKAGTVGYRNRWDKVKKKFIDGPLPKCDALPTGEYNFILYIHYRDRENQKVGGTAKFKITIGNPQTVTTTAPSAPAVVKNYKAIELTLPTPDYLLAVNKIINLANKNRANVSNGMVRVRSDLMGWTVAKNVKTAPYYLVWTVQSGNKHGMELLDRPKPFLYLNGQPIVFDYARGPQRYARDFITQIHSAKAVYLKPGDQLRIANLFNNALVGALRLYTHAPKTPLIRVKGFVKALFDRQIELKYKLRSQTNNEVKATASIRNMSDKVQSCEIVFTVKNWWQTAIKTSKSTISIPPYQSKNLAFTFPLKDSKRYTSTVNVSLNNAHQYRKTIDIQHSTTGKLRSLLWLNKAWTNYLVATDWNSPVPPRGKGGSKFDLPGMFYYNSGKTRLFCKDFSLPQSFKDKKIMLNFSGGGDEMKIWLNGKVIIKRQNLQRVPFKLDITDAVKLSATNRLAFVVAKSSRLPLRDIFISAMPKQHIAEILVTPSFRKKKLILKVKTGDADNLTLSGEVKYLGQTILKIPSRKLNAPQQNLQVAWDKPILWDIEHPRLLQLTLELKTSAGKIIDRKSVRFGFREIWVDGFNVMLNGIPQRFRAIAMNGGYNHKMVKNSSVRARIRLRKLLGINFLRHVYQGAAYAAIADEEGIFMAQGLLTVAHPTVAKINNEHFWQEKDRLSANIVLDLYNHPSIVEWYISNEFSESLQGAVRKLAIKRLITSQQAIRKIDSSRLFGHGCDLDLGGYNAFFSTHYPIDAHALRRLDAYTPDACLWHNPGQPLTKGMMAPCGQVDTVANVHFKSPIKWGTKPIFVGEFGWNMFYNPPAGFMQLFGDKVISSVWEVERAHLLTNAMFNAGHREAEVSLYTTWTHAENDPYRFVPAIDIYLWNQSHAWYSGSRIMIPINIFHEFSGKRSYKFTVSFEHGKSKQTVVDKTIDLAPMMVYRNKLTVTAPVVKTETAYKMHYLLKYGNKIIAKRTVKVKIYPAIRPFATPSRVMVYKPTAQLTQRLAKLKVTVSTLTTLSDLVKLPVQPLIIGRNSLNNAGADEISQLEKYVKRGGRVLVLQQRQVHGLFNLNATPKKSSIAFKRAFNAPETAQFTTNDFKYWYPDHLVSRYDYQKPQNLPGIILLDTASGMGGLGYTPLFKLTVGKGVCYLSQLEFAPTYRKSPIADQLFRSLLANLISFSPAREKLGTFVKAGSRLERFLQKLKLIIDNQQPLSAYSAIICDAELLQDNKFNTKVKQYLRNGGIVYFKNVNFTTQDAISKLLGTQLTFAKNDLPAVKGRMLILEHDSVLDGISQEDFFWRRWQENESTVSSFRTDKDFIAAPANLQGIVKNGDALLYPNSLIKLKSGNGTVYLDMLRWEQASPILKRKTSRIARSLLYNLGAKFKTDKTVVVNLKKVAFKVINLQPFFNRSLTDEKADDGQGSWNDQGPANDIVGVPSGQQTFNGIPFMIAKDKNCVTLHSKYRKAKLPYKVKIALTHRVAGLAFLYTSAWTSSKKHGAFIVHYSDGTRAAISLAGGKTLRDWVDANPSRDFMGESGINAELAASFATRDGRKASLFQLLWSNPSPRKRLSFISFESTNNAVMALLAITALVSPEKNVVKRATGISEVSLSFYNRGLRLYKKQQYNLAIKSFKSAIRASNSNYPAYLLAADIYKLQKKYPASEKLLLALIKIAPNQLEAYSKLGAIYERQGKYREALAIYRKSFKVDKNQPWIVQAIERMNKKISH